MGVPAGTGAGSAGRGRGGARGGPRASVPGAVAAMLAATAGLAFSASCAPPEPATIGREAFIETYVALRAAELRSPGAVIPEEARDSVLAAMGVSDEELVAFAEAHGDDVAFMEAVWTEVQNRMVELGSRPDTTR